MHNFSLSKKDQKRIWDEARNAAGPRYTKDINVELPIKELFEGIGRTDRVFEEIEGLRKELSESFKSVGYKKSSSYKDPVIRKNLTRIQELGKKYIEIINSLGKDRTKNLDLKTVIKEAIRISKYFLPIDRIIWDIERKEDEEQRQKAKEEKREYFGHSQSELLRDLKSLEHSLNEFQRAIRKIDYFAKSFKARLVNDPFLLVLGEAGMGKTHLVCDITKERIERQLSPTVIVLGEKLLDIDDPLESIFKACSLSGTSEKILRGLNDVGKRKKTRSLIIVDAINEADRDGWKSGVRKLIKQIKKYPWIGLVMTCRVPFQSLSLPKRFLIITEYHRGFTENELEAMTMFFNFYSIPLPEVPLLISEFSSPLFLSCFCKTAKNIRGGKAKVAQGIKDLALGQVGMTKILEDFYITKEEQIVKKHNSKFKLLIKQSWIWNKSGSNCLIKMVAESMANSGRRYLKNDEVVDLLRQLSGNKYQEAICSKVLNILIEEGVLIRDAAWDDQTKQYFDVIKFSFHKFSDHIIARYLLDNFFDRNKVKASLMGVNALGGLFRDQQSILSNIDLIEALMVEFPERIKKNKKLHEKDLIDFLPKDVRPLREVRLALIESLYWRKPENFLNNKKVIKKSIIDYINKTLLRYEDSRRELLDLFVSTATKPFHPLNAKRLNGYLSGFSVSSRDLFWSEYLRKQYGAGSVYKLVSWIENQNLEKITTEQAWCVITILGWVLTTNVRLLRDRATRCIYIIGKIQPEACFKSVLELANTNDPYIVERMLAATYGVVMALHASTNNAIFLKILYPFSKSVYSLFFKKKALGGTTNILTRDYARGIIEIALLHKKDLLLPAQIKRIRPPYKDGGIRQWGRSEDKDKGKYRDGNAPLGMDFENYTLGHLIPDRNNYDYKNKGFVRVKENALWRIYQLGYSLEKFGDIDKGIVSNTRMDRNPDYAGKVDRYGKKYSWIAYHELLGLKMDKKELARWWMTEDGRSGEFDVDPSFPQTPQPKRKTLISKNLTKGSRQIKKWLVQSNPPDISPYLVLENVDGIPGPWVLVHGTVGQKDTKLSRRITTFVTGLLADGNDGKKLKEFLDSKAFPGNDNIPSLPETRSIFAGELGWREGSKKDQPSYIKIQRGEKKVKLSKKEKRFYNIRIYINSEILKEKQEPPEFKIEPIYENILVEPLARWFSSKDYSCFGRDDYGIGLYIPSKKIMKANKLHTDVASFNFLDQKGGVASISFVRGDQYGTHENLLYLRKNLLDKILKKSGKKLFLIAWGERQFWPETGFEHRKELAPIYEKYQNVYKEVIEYGG
ncbi:hypothetical protein A2773_01190 [Candidatus Gottesmanbacteria bacterium RIFCSPHIGHO2_01_FULL_39_10]|uniref:Uncharacterized protein n=1 Tax=Candidatus Gottesmanbacteria bacterium RIFCSPHIGHO2_01_FULL_39_10 TaxID=1798375 RepID=A0A1F5ZMA9_9BACT|nr:MAG: hypothetical protein A2773_01190 [Candidatus Gottesmanbacteria bacterium RIFCSPHIGHO2_01_FULL_39_10]